MSTWALLGLVVVVVLVAVGITGFLRWGRNREDGGAPSDVDRPRTVADLVDRRARGLDDGLRRPLPDDDDLPGADPAAGRDPVPRDPADPRDDRPADRDADQAADRAHADPEDTDADPEDTDADDAVAADDTGPDDTVAATAPVRAVTPRPATARPATPAEQGPSSSAPDITEAAGDTGSTEESTEEMPHVPRITPDVSAGPVGPPWSRGFKDGKPLEPVEPVRRRPAPTPFVRRTPAVVDEGPSSVSTGPDSSAPDISTPGGGMPPAALSAVADAEEAGGAGTPSTGTPSTGTPSTGATATGAGTVAAGAGLAGAIAARHAAADPAGGADAAPAAPAAPAADRQPGTAPDGQPADAQPTATTAADTTDATATEAAPGTATEAAPATDVPATDVPATDVPVTAETETATETATDADEQPGTATDERPDAPAGTEAGHGSTEDTESPEAGADEVQADEPVPGAAARGESRSPVDPDLVRRVTAVPSERTAVRAVASPDTEREFREARDRISTQHGWTGRVPEQAGASEPAAATRIPSIGLARPAREPDNPEPPPRPAPRVLRSVRPPGGPRAVDTTDLPDEDAAAPSPEPTAPEQAEETTTVHAGPTATVPDRAEEVALLVPRTGPAPDAVVPGTAPRDVEVRVLDAADSVLTGAQVALRDRAGGPIGSAATGADGVARVAVPGEGEFVVVARLDGYRPGVATVTAGDGAAATLRLAAAAALHGTVAGGAGAEVALTQDGEPVASATAAADGTYRLTDLDPGRYRLAAGDGPAVDVELGAGADVAQDLAGS